MKNGIAHFIEHLVLESTHPSPFSARYGFFGSKPFSKTNEFLIRQGTTETTVGLKLSELLKRTEITYEALKELDPKRPELPRQVVEEVEIMVKYEGYIKMQEKQVEGFKKLEKKLLPDDVDYNTIKGIRLEAR